MNREQFQKCSIEDQAILVMETARANEYTFLKWFCELYDPRRFADGPLKSIIDDHSVFLSFVLSETIYLACPWEFVLLLRGFSRIDGLEKRICDLRGLNFLYKLMRECVNKRSADNDEIIKNGCICIGMLATQDEVRNQFKEEEIITLLLDLLKIFKTDLAFVKLLSNVLNNAVHKQVENKIILIENGGFLLLIEFLASNIDTTTKKAVVLLLRSISNLDQDRNYLTDTVDTAIEDILGNVQQEILNNCSDTYIHLIWTLLNLTINDSEFKRQVGVKDGCNQYYKEFNNLKK